MAQFADRFLKFRASSDPEAMELGSALRPKFGTGLHGELRVAFEYLHLEPGDFALFPEGSSELDAVAESAAIRTIAAFDGTGNADEFRFEELTGSVDDRVAPAAK